jgi:hypothetical protein
MIFAESAGMRTLPARIAAAAVVLVAAACSDKSTPATPTPTPQISVTGTWVGDVTVLNTQTRMTWTLTQSGTAVSGPVLLGLPSGTVLMNGFLTGSVNGSSMPYTITVGPGGIPSQPTCAGQVGGTMTIAIAASSTLSGTSSVTGSNCTPPFPGGTLTLTRQ